jgi:hypothetical protein
MSLPLLLDFLEINKVKEEVYFFFKKKLKKVL